MDINILRITLLSGVVKEYYVASTNLAFRDVGSLMSKRGIWVFTHSDGGRAAIRIDEIAAIETSGKWIDKNPLNEDRYYENPLS